MRTLLALLTAGLLTGCGKPDINDRNLSNLSLNLEDFFEGSTTAHGQFQDLFGNIQRRFTVDIEGTWDGRVLTLVEDFVYDDGSTEQRIWTLTKTGADTWVGTAPGVLGEARGTENGDVFNWGYRIDLPVRKGTTRVRFDDWMWLLSEDRVLNRAYMHKFGIRIGEAIIIFEKTG